MAKKKDKSAKPDKSAKIPKKLAGVKIPKTLRQEGEKLAELVKHPLVADLVAAGLVALAAKVRSSDGGPDRPGQGGTSIGAADDKGGSGKQRDIASELGQGAAMLATMLATKAGDKLRSAATRSEPETPPPTSTTPAAPTHKPGRKATNKTAH